MNNNLRVSPQYSPHGKLEAYKIEKRSPLVSDWLGRPQPDRWISIHCCLTKKTAEGIVSEGRRVRRETK